MKWLESRLKPLNLGRLGPNRYPTHSQRTRQLPKILPINHGDWRRRCIKVVKQARVHADAAGGSVPSAIRLKGWAVAEGAAATDGAEMVRHQFGVPAVNRIASAIAGEVKLRGFVVRMQHAAF